MSQSQSVSSLDLIELNQLSKDELIGIVLAQQNIIDQLKQEINQLQKKIEKLKVSRDLDSKTSSKPPSTDLPKKSEKAKPSDDNQTSHKSKRKPGGQPGHPGKTRKGFARVDRTEILQPLQCSECGERKFKGEPVKVDSQQVAQLVERPIEVVEYHRYHCQCNRCGAITSATWSPKMIPGQDLGLKLQAFLGWLGNYGHLPYEKQQEMLWELGEIEIGLGTLVTTNQRVERAINPSVKELSEWLKATQPNLHVDETPWPVKGIKEWLWVFTNPVFCLFRAADTRSRAEVEDQLGRKYSGVLSSDDLSVYNGYPVIAQQKCLAHLRRHCQRLTKLSGKENQSIGQAFIDLIDEAFAAHGQWRQTQDDLSYRYWAVQFQAKVELTINKWITKAGSEAGKLLRSLKTKEQQWWYFLEHPEVPPDNNLAERSLRLAVTKRKVSGGSRSMNRFKHTANLLTVVQTCRRQGRSVIDFFEKALVAIASHSTCPSLVPISNT